MLLMLTFLLLHIFFPVMKLCTFSYTCNNKHTPFHCACLFQNTLAFVLHWALCRAQHGVCVHMSVWIPCVLQTHWAEEQALWAIKHRDSWSVILMLRHSNQWNRGGFGCMQGTKFLILKSISTSSKSRWSEIILWVQFRRRHQIQI